MTRAKFAVVVVGLTLLPMLASAQSSISGLVRDTSGAVMPNVTVEALSPALIEKSRTVTTDNAGRYTIGDIRPGIYTVYFTLSGLTTVDRTGIAEPSYFWLLADAEVTSR